MADDNGNVFHTLPSTPVKRIHLVGVAGTGMGSFAGMLKSRGYEVTGSDENVYPPMSDMLKAWGIPAMTPYSPENLDAARPDLVIIGNVIRRVNPEATAVRERGIPQMSFPAAMGALFLEGHHSVVVAGTHGKTTTSALMAHVLVDSGRDPSFLVGGVTLNFASNYRVGKGEHVVVEGDEYDTAYFDKGPKFFHYRPRTVILTSVEFDHADIYRDMAHYTSAFAGLVERVPAEGHIAVAASYPNAVALARAGKAEVTTYSGREGADADVTPVELRFGPEGASFRVKDRGALSERVVLPMAGEHNVENAMSVWAAARSLGLTVEELSRAFASFKGVKRRQELRAEPGGIMVIDDFAHHPTAVRETIAAIHGRWPDRRLWAIFEPRSNTSRRNIHQEEYAHAFTGASRVSIKTPERHDRVPAGEELDVHRVVAALKGQGIEAECEAQVEPMIERVLREARAGDILLVMSNGAFGGFISKTIAALEARG